LISPSHYQYESLPHTYSHVREIDTVADFSLSIHTHCSRHYYHIDHTFYPTITTTKASAWGVTRVRRATDRKWNSETGSEPSPQSGCGKQSSCVRRLILRVYVNNMTEKNRDYQLGETSSDLDKSVSVPGGFSKVTNTNCPQIR
jgi:hypothetical protein